MSLPARIATMWLGLTLVSSAAASEYCTKEQYERDHAFIDSAISAGTLVGPKSLYDPILVHEGMWFDMNYPEQTAFMQRFECAMGGAGGKHLLCMEVKSLGTGKLLATWFFGVLEPAQDVTNPGMSEGNPGMSGDENRIGLTGEARAAFIKSAIDACNKNSNSAPPTYCSCYANAMADSVSIKELKETSASGNREAGMTALRPKIEAAARRCQRPSERCPGPPP
jgi:hypothetical protein